MWATDAHPSESERASMTGVPKVFADFNDLLGLQDRLRLDTVGAREDLRRQVIALEEGQALLLYDHDEDAEGNRDDLVVEGTVRWDRDLNCWVAVIDRSAIRHESQHPSSQ